MSFWTYANRQTYRQSDTLIAILRTPTEGEVTNIIRTVSYKTRMWANAQRNGRPAEYRWRPLFNAAKFG